MLKRTMSLLTLTFMLASLLAACGSAPATTAPTAAPAAAATAAPAPAATTAPAAAVPTEAPKATEAPQATEAAPTEAAAEKPTEAAPPTPTQVNISTFDQAAAGNRTVIKWFVGLGAGTQPPQIPLEQEAVKKFNESQDKIYLALEIIDNRQAFNALATRIASGDVPDIIGPVGVRGRNAFKGQLLDLTDLIKTNKVDLSQYPPELIQYYNVEGQGQIGLPYAIYPSFIYYNKDLFDEAGLKYPPQKFGDKYTMPDGKQVDWNMETLRELAMKLTVDDQGNDATSSSFNPDKVVQFGLHGQWVNQDIRALGTIFGAGSVVSTDGKAQLPDQWRAAAQWWHDAFFKDHFAPSDAYINSDAFGNSNVFNTGKLAMAWTHIWYTGALDGPDKGAVKNWDIAVVPSYNGQYTAKLHADTFSIMKGTQHQQEAFQVLQFLLKSPELVQAYGAMPAVKSEQPAYFKQLDEKFAPNKVNWQVALDSLQHVDVPSHEEDLPNYVKAQNDLQTFTTSLRTDPKMEVNTSIEDLVKKLQADYDEAK
jgi:multiple sugar transport system substrate-binding protein